MLLVAIKRKKSRKMSGFEGKGVDFTQELIIFAKSYIGCLTGSMETFHVEIRLGSPSLGGSLNTHLWLLSAATLPTNLQTETIQLIHSFSPTAFWKYIWTLTLLQNCTPHETFWRRYQFQTSPSCNHSQFVHILINHKTHLPTLESWNQKAVNWQQEFGHGFSQFFVTYQFLLFPLERSRAVPPYSHLQETSVI